MDRVLLAVAAVVGVPAATCGYIVLAERLIGLLPDKRRNGVRPWLWIAPALLFLLLFLVYPSVRTIAISLYGPQSKHFVGLGNYGYILSDQSTLLVLRNNVIWLVVFTLATVLFGLIIAVLTDRVRYEAIAKTTVFLPMAISFVGAGVIWKFIYAYQPPGAAQIGLLDALLTAVIPGFKPVAWLINSPINTFALIVVAVWVWTGFCTVILSAALKGMSKDVLEAARVDGANEWQIFYLLTVPLISPTIAVVTTTMIIFALKAFDIVYVMTSGNFQTDVIANRMYTEMFTDDDFGRAAAFAVILLLAIVPIMAGNVQRFRNQEEIR